MKARDSVSIALPTELLNALHGSVARGERGSTDEAIVAALRVWGDRGRTDAERFAASRARIQDSLDDPGRDMTLEEMNTDLAEAFVRAERASGNQAA